MTTCWCGSWSWSWVTFLSVSSGIRSFCPVVISILNSTLSRSILSVVVIVTTHAASFPPLVALAVPIAENSCGWYRVFGVGSNCNCNCKIFRPEMQMMAGRGPTHLVALYVATAGQQGNALGSDEEEITLLVYVLIDALQNKVNRPPLAWTSTRWYNVVSCKCPVHSFIHSSIHPFIRLFVTRIHHNSTYLHKSKIVTRRYLHTYGHGMSWPPWTLCRRALCTGRGSALPPQRTQIRLFRPYARFTRE